MTPDQRLQRILRAAARSRPASDRVPAGFTERLLATATTRSATATLVPAEAFAWRAFAAACIAVLVTAAWAMPGLQQLGADAILQPEETWVLLFEEG